VEPVDRCFLDRKPVPKDGQEDMMINSVKSGTKIQKNRQDIFKRILLVGQWRGKLDWDTVG